MSDLDDEEIKATRILNGVDKENNNIEKDVERCKQLIRVEHANWIGISNQLAIAHVVERIKELEAKLEFKNWGDLDNTQFEEYMNQFIPKQKVKDLIENETINISGFECIAVEDLEELLIIRGE